MPDLMREVEKLYRGIVAGWNSADASGFASKFAKNGVMIGYDGSPVEGRAEIERHIGAIFADHRPGQFVIVIRDTRALDDTTAILRAAVGVIPLGQSEVMKERNFLQTLVAVKHNDIWEAALLQATPAQFHGRPEMSAALTAELQDAAADAELTPEALDRD